MQSSDKGWCKVNKLCSLCLSFTYYLIKNPEEPQEIAGRIYTFITELKKNEKMEFSVQKWVLEKFLTFHPMSEWLRVFHHLLQQQNALIQK